MIVACNESWSKKILDYIGERYSECLYLYIDFIKYGMSVPFVHVYVDVDASEELRCILLQYHQGLHIFSRDLDFDLENVTQKVRELSPAMICGTDKIIQKLAPSLSNYEAEFGYVAEIKEVKWRLSDRVQKAEISDLPEIAEMLCADEGIGGSYTVEEMLMQIKERYESGFGRNYIIRDGSLIASHMSTGAELANLAITSGAITRPEYKRKGLAADALARLCTDLLNEGKRAFAVFYVPAAIRLHEKVGHEICHGWAKLTKQKEKG